MPQSMTTARLELLGGGFLCLGGKRIRLERKTLGCLAYLALEGEQLRYTLAGLLWADVTEARAKGNLRQCLYKLRQLAPIVEGDASLRLVGVEVDLLQLQNAALLGDYLPLTTLRGQFLEGHLFDDCPDFEDWVERTRQRFLVLRRNAFSAQIEQTRTPWQMLEFAQTWQDLEPLSEMALKALVRALLELGHSLQARAAIEAFAERHQREYNEPAPNHLFWLEPKQLEEDANALLEAAATANQALQNLEASRLYLRAADAFALQNNIQAECDALLQAAKLMASFDRTERYDALLHRIAGVARTPMQVLAWRIALMYRAYQKAEWENCLREAKRVGGLAARLEQPLMLLDAQGFIAAIQVELGNIEAAAQGFEAVLATTRQLGKPEMIAQALHNLAYAKDHQGQRHQSIVLLTEALEIAEALGDVEQQLVTLNQLTLYTTERQEKWHFAKRGLALHQRITGQEAERINNLVFLAELQRNQGFYREALVSVHQALELAKQQNLPRAYLHRIHASILLQLGAFEAAHRQLEQGLARPDATESDLLALTAVQLRLRRWAGTGTLEALEDTLAAWQHSRNQGFLNRFLFEKSYCLKGVERLALVEATVQNSTGFVRFFLALAHLEAGQPELALPISLEVMALFADTDPNDLYAAEILFTHARILTALQDPSAQNAWQQARDWVLDKAKHHVPQEYKQDFLEAHPINHAILNTDTRVTF